MLWYEVYENSKEYRVYNIGKIIWENNLINNCNMIKQNFKWAGEIIELVQNNPQPKSLYLKEINDLKL